MGERIEQIKRELVRFFPKLKDDDGFKITSKETPAYNCIAWAYNIDNRWMWPNTGEYEFLDGVHYWPTDEIQEASIENFIKLRIDGSIIPIDGIGHPHDGEIELEDIDVFDITIRDIYKYPYVCWYNK